MKIQQREIRENEGGREGERGRDKGWKQRDENKAAGMLKDKEIGGK